MPTSLKKRSKLYARSEQMKNVHDQNLKNKKPHDDGCTDSNKQYKIINQKNKPYEITKTNPTYLTNQYTLNRNKSSRSNRNSSNKKNMLVPRTIPRISLPFHYQLYQHATINDYQLLLAMLFCENVIGQKEQICEELVEMEETEDEKTDQNKIQNKCVKRKDKCKSVTEKDERKIQNKCTNKIQSVYINKLNTGVRSDPFFYLSSLLSFSSQHRHENKFKGLSYVIECLLEGGMCEIIRRLRNDFEDDDHNIYKVNCSRDYKIDGLINYKENSSNNHHENGLNNHKGSGSLLSSKQHIVLQFTGDLLCYLRDCLNCKFIGNKCLVECLPILSFNYKGSGLSELISSDNYKGDGYGPKKGNSFRKQIGTNQSNTFTSNTNSLLFDFLNNLCYTILYQIRKKEGYSLIKHFLIRNRENLIAGRAVNNNGCCLSLLVLPTLKHMLLTCTDWLFKKRLVECLFLLDEHFIVEYMEQLIEYCYTNGIITNIRKNNKEHISSTNTDKNNKGNAADVHTFSFTFQSFNKRDEQLVKDLYKKIMIRRSNTFNNIYIDTLSMGTGSRTYHAKTSGANTLMNTASINWTLDDLPFLISQEWTGQIPALLTSSNIHLLSKRHLDCNTSNCSANKCLLRGALRCMIRNQRELRTLMDWNIAKVWMEEMEEYFMESSNKNKDFNTYISKDDDHINKDDNRSRTNKGVYYRAISTNTDNIKKSHTRTNTENINNSTSRTNTENINNSTPRSNENVKRLRIKDSLPIDESWLCRSWGRYLAGI